MALRTAVAVVDDIAVAGAPSKVRTFGHFGPIDGTPHRTAAAVPVGFGWVAPPNPSLPHNGPSGPVWASFGSLTSGGRIPRTPCAGPRTPLALNGHRNRVSNREGVTMDS